MADFLTASTSGVDRPTDPPLSSRGQALYEVGQMFRDFQKIMRDIYHPQNNPDGGVLIAVAENSLMHNELIEYFERKFYLIPADFGYGDGIIGTKRLTSAFANFLNSRFNPQRPIIPDDHLMMGAGVEALVSQVARVIADPGDGILLAAPYYQGFDMCLPVQNGIIPVEVSVPPSEMCTMAELTYLEKGLRESNAKGTVVKGVILCNPHNPLGRCYTREVVIAYCRFCETHNLHLIADEIYALSVFPSRDIPNPNPFVSTLSIDLEACGVTPSRVHVLYGMSKDFNANGFRAGGLISQYNPSIIQSLMTSGPFILVANPSDSLWSSLLNDESYLPIYIETNQAKLREAYEYITSWLKFHNVPYIPSSAGLFLMVDWRPVLSNFERYGSILSITPDQSMRERESTLFAFLLAHKVMAIPGAMCHMAEPGWFRFTFSVRRDYLDVALARIEKALEWEAWPLLSASGKPPVVDHPSAGDAAKAALGAV